MSAIAATTRSVAWAARRGLRACGVDVARYSEQSADWQFAAALRRHAINTVIDAGANRGQFGRYLRLQGYTGTIELIEPFPDAYTELATHARRDPRWNTHAIGLAAATGRATLNIGANDQTSSLHETLPLGAAMDAVVDTVGKIDVAVESLYDFVRHNRIDPAGTLLKLDVQGSEHDILSGSPETLRAIPLLFIECAVVPIYGGDLPLGEMIAFLHGNGFGILGLKGGFFSPDTGEMMQIDVLAGWHRSHLPGAPQ